LSSFFNRLTLPTKIDSVILSGIDDNKKLTLKEYREYLYNHISNKY